MRWLLKLSAAGAAFLLLAASPSDFSREELETLNAQLEDTLARLEALEAAESRVGEDLSTIEADLITAALESRRKEEQASASELRLIDLQTRLKSAHTSLLEDETALEDLLAALAASGRHRPPALIASPNEANTAIRSAILMSDVAPSLQSRTEELARRIDELKKLEAETRREQSTLRAAEEELENKQREIRELAAVKRARFETVSGEADALRAELKRIGDQAQTLQQLLDALENQAPTAPRAKPQIGLANMPSPSPADPVRKAPDPIDPALKPLGPSDLGGLSRPTSGMVSVRWGDTLPGGETSKGIYLRPRPGAQVTSPVDGRIAYAEPFRSYGLLLILETSDGYHIVLSGMGQIYGAPGQTVKSGEPVGIMPTRENPAPELYLEVRKDGQPMNPANWLKDG